MLHLNLIFSDKWVSNDVAPLFPVICESGKSICKISSNCNGLICSFLPSEDSGIELTLKTQNTIQKIKIRIRLDSGDWTPYYEERINIPENHSLTGFQYYIYDQATDLIKVERYCDLMSFLREFNVDRHNDVCLDYKKEIINAYIELITVYRYIDWSLWVKTLALAMDTDNDLYFRLIDTLNKYLLIRK